MIIKFSIDNWMSFRDTAAISMVASLERQHGSRIPRADRYAMKILPVAAIFGGNASGKTNFFKALLFIRRLVLSESKATDLASLEQFRLGNQPKRPTTFCLDLLIDNCIFEFSITATEEEIVEEKLSEMGPSGDRVLYHRSGGSITFDETLHTDQFLHYAHKGTGKSQLFISNCASQNIETFMSVYDWFKHSLVLISPDSRFAIYERLIGQNLGFQNLINSTLASLDTGISQLASEEISLDSLGLSEDMRGDINQEASETRFFRLETGHDIVLIGRENGRIVGRKLVTYHGKQDGSNEKFEIHNESDGSRRAIDLLPAFLSISSAKSKQVLVVDELDRSLHTLLTRRMLEEYLATCSSQSRSQLLFSTHDVLLMDQKIFRRDEMWVTERDRDGATTLISFNDYKDIRYDKDIRKSYLSGRMGGVPRLSYGALFNPEIEEIVN